MFTKTIELVHQTGPREFWMLNGLTYRQGLFLASKGWTWLKGPQGGCWVTEDAGAVKNIGTQS